MMIDLEFLVMTILLFLNLTMIMIKDKNLVYISWLLTFFTWIMCGVYLIDLIPEIGLWNLKSLYILFIGVVASILLIEKGLEKW